MHAWVVVPAQGLRVHKTQPELFSSSILIREAIDEDSQDVISLIDEVWREYPGKILNVDVDMPELRHVASYYRAARGVLWVAEFHRRVIGSIGLKPSESSRGVELQKLYVKRGHRRRGLGSYLCGLVEDEARQRGCAFVELWSDVKLQDAHRLYRDLGYEGGVETRAYADSCGTQRWYFRKELAPAQQRLVHRLEPA